MTTTAAARTRENVTTSPAKTVSKRRANFNEGALGLLFVAPVAIITLVFQLFPVLYGFYMSMQGGVIIPDGVVGLKHYARAVGSLAYMLILVLAFVAGAAAFTYYRRGRLSQQEGKGDFFAYLLPGFLGGAGIIGGVLITFFLNITYALPAILVVIVAFAWFQTLNNRDGSEKGGAAYVVGALAVGMGTISAIGLTLFTFSELYGALMPYLTVLEKLITNKNHAYIFPLLPQFIAFGSMLACVAGIIYLTERRRLIERETQPGLFALAGTIRLVLGFIISLLLGFLVGAQEALIESVLSLTGITNADVRALSLQLTGTRFSLETMLNGIRAWNEVFSMLVGIMSIGLAWYVWGLSRRRETTLGMVGAILMSIFLMGGGVLFLGILPGAGSAGDPEFFQSMLRTFSYAIMTVPIQLVLGLLLAYMLYYEVRWGKSLYRIVFFMPYIAPAVVTAAVFSQIFSLREAAPANQFVQALGFPPLEWLRTPKGIFQILAEHIGGANTRLPDFLVGPSLPLVSASIYAIWVFSGYNAVIFMAGLGNVPKDMYEAAQVDGAGRWATFRQIIFPLISPTTFFLTVLAVIGTLRAFTHIWVLRQEAARGAMDTTTVYIYTILIETSQIKTRPFAAALSFLLFGVILIMTIIQNRLSKDRVFYG